MNAARITIVDLLYHQPTAGGAAPVVVESRFEHKVTSDEQPYVRITKVGGDWQTLDTGWVKHPSFVVITNNEGTFLEKQPSPAERAEVAAHVIELGSDNYCLLLIRPGESLRLSPVDASDWQIRCSAGSARVTISAFPE